VKTTLSIVSYDVSTGDASTKSFGNIIQGFVGLAGGTAPALPYINGEQIESLGAWLELVRNGIYTLSTNMASNATINFSVQSSEFYDG